MPENMKGFSGDEDLVKRHLDCAVINFLHQARERSSSKEVNPFDSVRGIFVEGSELYPGAKIMSQTHIQICIRIPEKSVIGYFMPRLSGRDDKLCAKFTNPADQTSNSRQAAPTFFSHRR